LKKGSAGVVERWIFRAPAPALFQGLETPMCGFSNPWKSRPLPFPMLGKLLWAGLPAPRNEREKQRGAGSPAHKSGDESYTVRNF
jgi:hypothetical protein